MCHTHEFLFIVSPGSEHQKIKENDHVRSDLGANFSCVNTASVHTDTKFVHLVQVQPLLPCSVACYDAGNSAWNLAICLFVGVAPAGRVRCPCRRARSSNVPPG